MEQRLQKLISQAGKASRRQAEQWIVDGRVTVNGKIVNQLGTKVSEKDVVKLDGILLEQEKHTYVLLNKPKGVLTTLHDPQGRKTVAHLVKDIPVRLYPVGRLDYNTEGILLLTNDGTLTQMLTHPSHHVPKIYIAKVLGIPEEDKLDRLRVGIRLEDGVTQPAKVDILEIDRELQRTTVQVTLYEGKNRQVRRMFEAIGHPVRSLKRIQLAFLTLQGLRRGQYRLLTDSEVERLKKLCTASNQEI